MTATRLISVVTAFVVGLLVVGGVAFAQPSPADMAAAKKAYTEGKAAYDKKNYDTAVSKFKESYKLSKNPLLLYNIGLTYEDMGGSEDLALVNYRKFLADAPPDAAQREDVAARVKNLEKKLGLGTTAPDAGTKPNPDAGKPPGGETPPANVQIKPAGTYAAKDFQHVVVMEAPPGKPLDVTAFVPEDSGWTVTLYFRGAGDTKFYTKPMKWRYKELVARIPAAKVGGQSIQYYVEVKDQAGQVVTRSGKSTSPNIVDMVATAPPRFYPDWSDDGNGEAANPVEVKRHDNEEDPLHKGGDTKQPDHHDDEPIGGPTPTGPEGPVDDTFVGSKSFRYAKWGTTIGAVAFLGLGVVGYLQAGSYANALKDDVTADCMSGQTPPCRQFDSYDQDLQSKGHMYQTIERVMLPLGVVTAGVAGYLWYREMKAKKHHAANAPANGPAPAKAPEHDELGMVVVPTATDTFVGAAALVTF